MNVESGYEEVVRGLADGLLHEKRLQQTLSSDEWQYLTTIDANQYSFILKFFKYDQHVENGAEYALKPSFDKIFSTRVQLHVHFKHQVFLSKVVPPGSITILETQPETVDRKYYYPSGTYAFSVAEPMIIQYNRQV